MALQQNAKLKEKRKYRYRHDGVVTVTVRTVVSCGERRRYTTTWSTSTWVLCAQICESSIFSNFKIMKWLFASMKASSSAWQQLLPACIVVLVALLTRLLLIRVSFDSSTVSAAAELDIADVAGPYCSAIPTLRWDHAEPPEAFLRRVAALHRPTILLDAPGIARRTDAASARALFRDAAYLSERRRRQHALQRGRAASEGEDEKPLLALESDVTTAFASALHETVAQLVTNASSDEGAILVKVARNRTFVYNAWAPLAELPAVIRAVRGQPSFVRMHFDGLFRCIAQSLLREPASAASRNYCYHSHTLGIEPDIEPIDHLLMPCTPWADERGVGISDSDDVGIVWCGNASAHYFNASVEAFLAHAAPQPLSGATSHDLLLHHLATWFRGIRKKERESHTSINLWIGGGGSTAGAHFDMSHNIFTQVAGQRVFLLFPPDAHTALRIHPQQHPSSRQVQTDPERALHCIRETVRAEERGNAVPPCAVEARSRELRSRLRAADGSCLLHTLSAGETLYLPPLWFHWVRSLSNGPDVPSIAVNVWSRSRVSNVHPLMMGVLATTRLGEIVLAPLLEAGGDGSSSNVSAMHARMERNAALALALVHATVGAVLRRDVNGKEKVGVNTAHVIERQLYAPRFAALVEDGILRAPANCSPRLAANDPDTPLVAAATARLVESYFAWMGSQRGSARDQSATRAIALGNWVEALALAAVGPRHIAHFVKCATMATE